MLLSLGFAGSAAFLDNALSILVCFAKDFLATELRLGELLFDFFGIFLSFLDDFPAALKDIDDWSKSKFFQDGVNDEKKNCLGDEFRPSDSKGGEQLCDGIHVAQ